MAKKRNLVVALCAALIMLLLITVVPVSVFAEEIVAEDAQTAAVYASYFSGGDGSVTNPYLISNESQLTHIREVGYTDSNGRYCIDKAFKLTNHIKMNLYNPWTPIQGYFTGRFDGSGYAIQELKIYADNFQYIGLFERLENAVIKNVSIGEFKINGTSENSSSPAYVGVIAGEAANSTIVDSAFSGEINVPFRNARCGGVVGYMSGGTISSCTNYSAVTGCGYVGGIVGLATNGALISNCSNCWHITYKFNRQSGCAGGIAGSISNNATIDLCTATDRSRIIYGGMYSYVGGDIIKPCMGQIVGLSYYANVLATTISGTTDYSGLNSTQDEFCSKQVWGRIIPEK